MLAFLNTYIISNCIFNSATDWKPGLSSLGRQFSPGVFKAASGQGWKRGEGEPCRWQLQESFQVIGEVMKITEIWRQRRIQGLNLNTGLCEEQAGRTDDLHKEAAQVQ